MLGRGLLLVARRVLHVPREAARSRGPDVIHFKVWQIQRVLDANAVSLRECEERAVHAPLRRAARLVLVSERSKRRRVVRTWSTFSETR